jgi:hypothetical protein
MQPNNEGKKAKGGWVLCNSFFWGFVLWWVLFFLYVFVKPNFFLITKNLVIIYKLSKIEDFYHKVNNFAMVLVFKFFCRNFKEITKEKEKEKENQ